MRTRGFRGGRARHCAEGRRAPRHRRLDGPSLHAGEGDSEVPKVRDQTPELLEHVVRMFLASRVQRALHVLEPKTSSVATSSVATYMACPSVSSACPGSGPASRTLGEFCRGDGGGTAGRRRHGRAAAGPASCSRPAASAAFAPHRARPASRGACGVVDSAHRCEPASTCIPRRYAFASGGHRPKYSRARSSIAAGNGSASSPAAIRSTPTHSAARTSAEPEQRAAMSVATCAEGGHVIRCNPLSCSVRDAEMGRRIRVL